MKSSTKAILAFSTLLLTSAPALASPPHWNSIENFGESQAPAAPAITIAGESTSNFDASHPCTHQTESLKLRHSLGAPAQGGSRPTFSSNGGSESGT